MIRFLGEKLRSISLRTQLSPGHHFRSVVMKPVNSHGSEWTYNLTSLPLEILMC